MVEEQEQQAAQTNPDLGGLVDELAKVVGEMQLPDGVYRQIVVMEVNEGQLIIHGMTVDKCKPKKPTISLDTKL